MNKEQAIKERNLEKIRKRWQEEMQGDVANLAWCDIDSLIAEIENTWKQNKYYREVLEKVRQNMIGHYGLGGERDTYVRWSKELIDRTLEGEE